MATAFKIQVPAHDTGLLRVAQDNAAAAKVSELLQRDLEVVAPVRVRASSGC